MEGKAIADLNKAWLVRPFVVVGGKTLQKENIFFWRPGNVLWFSADIAGKKKWRIVHIR
jgi:hypothetical protein